MKLIAAAGGFSESTPASISYLWTNWHDYFCIDRALFQVRRLSKASWEATARSIPGSGEWHLLESKYGASDGYFRFISYVKFSGQLVRGESSFVYQKHLDGTCWFVAETSGRLPPLLNPMSPMLRPVVAGVAKEFGVNGGKVAAEITRNRDLVQRRCGVAALEKYREYIADEETLQSDSARKLEHMSPSDAGDVESAELLDQLFGSDAAEFLSVRRALRTDIGDLNLLGRATLYGRYRMPFAGLVQLGWLAERLWRQPEIRKKLDSKARAIADFTSAKHKVSWGVPEGEQQFAADMRRFGDLYLRLMRIGALVADRHD